MVHPPSDELKEIYRRYKFIHGLGELLLASTLNLTKGYWQVAMTPDAIPEAAISTSLGN